MATTLAPPAGAGGAPPPSLVVLSPGGVGEFFDVLPVNVVFVGYEPGDAVQEIDPESFLGDLPSVTAGLALQPAVFGNIRPSYIAWQLDYRLHFAPEDFDDAFFDMAVSEGHERPLTGVQELYNEEAPRSLDIASTIEIDAVATERWLAENAQASLGIDTTRPTAFFINWFGRDDFRFHVYGKSGEPDPDTGVDFGSFDSRKVIAWGGTASDDPSDPPYRTWFHDLSAGPDFITENWDLTVADVDGDTLPDYRLPPVWEYGNTSGYRPFTDLTGDLAKIMRYVAVDSLFAPSPIYDPVISAPRIPSDIDVTVNRFIEGAPAEGPSGPYVIDKLSDLQPWNSFEVDQRSTAFDGRIAEVHACFLSALADPAFVGQSCYGKRGSGFSYWDLFLYYLDNRIQLSDPSADYSAAVLSFELNEIDFLSGLAAEDPRDGSQSYIMLQTSPGQREQGAGPSHTLAHEVGHHLGLAHPHDGFDFEQGIIFQPRGDFFFTWAGTESATLMAYNRAEDDFSRFERDSMGRWMAVGYLNQSNQILAKIFRSRHARQEDGAVLAADQAALGAVIAYYQTDYQGSALLAKRAYDILLGAAGRLRIPIEPEARQADMKAESANGFFVDPVDPFGSDTTNMPPTREIDVDLPKLPPAPTGWVYPGKG